MATEEVSSAPRRPVSKVTDLQLVEKRQREVVEAATKLVAERGFARTSVADVAREANMSIGLLYAYVRTKEDILFLIVEFWSGIWMRGLRSAVDRQTDPLARLLSALEFLIDRGQTHPDVINLFYRETGNLDENGRTLFKQGEKEQVDFLLRLIQDAVDAGLLREGAEADYVATAFSLLTHGWVLKSRFRRSRDPRAFARLILETFVLGFGTENGVARLSGLWPRPSQPTL